MMTEAECYCIKCGCRTLYCYYIQSRGPFCYDCYREKSEDEFHTNYTYTPQDVYEAQSGTTLG